MAVLLSIIHGQTPPNAKSSKTYNRWKIKICKDWGIVLVTYIITSGVRKYSVETIIITAFKKKVSRISRNV